MAQQKKDQLREFLCQNLDAGEIPALKWTNKNNFEFRLEWKHKKDAAVGREEDAIFRKWAEHKGNSTSNITKLKENFRKALQKSPFVDILHEDKGLGYKICRLKYDTEGDKPGTTSGTRRRKEGRGQAITAEMPELARPLSAAENRRLRATYEDTTPPRTPPSPMELSTSCPSITDIDVNMEFELNSDEWQELYDDFEAAQPEDITMEECGVGMPAGRQEPKMCQGKNQLLPRQRSHEMEEQQELITLPSDLTTGHYHGIDFRKAERPDGSVQLGVHDIFLLIKHRRCVLNRCHIACPRGFKISYLKPDERDVFELPGVKRLGAEPIRPDIIPFSEAEDAQVTHARGILEALGQGLYVYADEKGNIHAVRISSLEIFYANTIFRGNQASPELLPINHDVIVFDLEVYRKAFENWLVEKKGPKPDVRVLFSVNEKWSIADPHDKCAINITIANARLLFQKKQFGAWWPKNGHVPAGQLKQSEFVNGVVRQF